MTPEREAQMREAFEKWELTENGWDRSDLRTFAESEIRYMKTQIQDDWTTWLACARALEPKWQPIETAPKDGRMFLCWVSAIRHTHINGEFGIPTDVSEADFCQWNNNDGNGYWDNMMGQIGDEYAVTHWMSLPEQPKAAMSAALEDGNATE